MSILEGWKEFKQWRSWKAGGDFAPYDPGNELRYWKAEAGNYARLHRDLAYQHEALLEEWHHRPTSQQYQFILRMLRRCMDIMWDRQNGKIQDHEAVSALGRVYEEYLAYDDWYEYEMEHADDE